MGIIIDMASLDDLERRLQELIEVKLLNLLPRRKAEDVVAQQLAAAIKARLSDDSKSAPSMYAIKVNPAAAEQWKKDPRLVEELTQIVRQVASEMDITFETPPAIHIQPEPSLGPEDVQITATFPSAPVAETQAFDSALAEPKTDELPKNAFLIIGGERVFPLKTAVINIGRRADNNLVIDDPRISRYHSQIRAIRARFVIFDLNSTGGTFVNGERTSQSVLYPGDVISLAGLPIIFGMDNPPASYVRTNDFPISKAASERPTAIFKKDDFK